MSKYPGAKILYEYGTLKELSSSWGVSERTISRWKAKARSETGERGGRKPRLSTIANFKGTRKELAKKYHISERTAYRWLNKAREKGYDVEDRQKKAKYPGEQILFEYGTNKELAKSWGVSERTISRWKARAKLEQKNEEQDNLQTPEIETPETFNIEEPEISEEEPEISEEDYQEQLNDFIESLTPKSEEEYEEEVKDYVDMIIDRLTERDVIKEDSSFYKIPPEYRNDYIQSYIDYQYKENKKLFYNPETGETDLSPDFVSNINIWGAEFEQWCEDQINAQDYEV